MLGGEGIKAEVSLHSNRAARMGVVGAMVRLCGAGDVCRCDRRREGFRYTIFDLESIIVPLFWFFMLITACSGQYR